jgi:hypothetical protein
MIRSTGSTYFTNSGISYFESDFYIAFSALYRGVPSSPSNRDTWRPQSFSFFIVLKEKAKKEKAKKEANKNLLEALFLKRKGGE